jgi:AraC-like DNA-binding protein
MENFSNQFIQALLAYAAQRDISVKRLCEASAIDYATLQQQKGYAISPEKVNSLWRNAAHFSNDAHFGLHFGESMQLAALGVIGQIISTSQTVGEALSQASNLVPLLTDLFSVEVNYQETSFQVVLAYDDAKRHTFPHTFRHMADYLMVFALHELDGLTMERLKPLAIGLRGAESLREFERIFSCKIHPNQDEIFLEFPMSCLSIPIFTANYDLQKVLLEQVSGLVQPISKESVWQNKIYNYLLTNSYLYSQSLENVAANFNTSPRSLQRRLREEGVSFLDVVDKVRKTLSISYLASGNYQVKDVAYTLGYNDPSAFLRAFKRWTGTTPSVYRQQIR